MAQIKAFLGNTFDTVSVHEPKAEAQEIIENRRFASCTVRFHRRISFLSGGMRLRA
jgi:hypothetical protein